MIRVLSRRWGRRPLIPQRGRCSSGGRHAGDSGGKYSRTVLLPTTQFSQRANAVTREPEIQQFWAEKEVFGRVNDSNNKGTYVLHDGPPYANGDLHIGHALNKILKDFIVKYQLLRGKKVCYIPGWDCHGLPIELKVLQSLKGKEKSNLTPLDLRGKAYALASNTMSAQSKSFQRYGVWGEWSNPYATFHPTYEAQQIKVFGDMVRKGYIYRGKKPVHWSPSSRTALAEAELEYPPNHISKAIYVSFCVQDISTSLLEKLSHPHLDGVGRNLKVAVWTTTPWTLPANQAVAVNPTLEYSIVSHPCVDGGSHFVVATDLISQFTSVINQSQGGADNKESSLVFNVYSDIKLTGSDLVGTTYHHPIHDRSCRIVVGGSYITSESGTGLVHTAPGHGSDDFITGQRENLDIVSPVDDAGRFTAEAGEALMGKDVLKDGNTAVMEILQEKESLLFVEDYSHKYPYDWRTKKPTITRTTEQWFASVEAFRDDVITAIESVSWVPEIGQKRISSMIMGRKDWCISRQRSWGVPIPAFYHAKTGEVLMNEDTISHVESIFREHGSDAWWNMDISDLLPSSLKHLAGEYEKGTDTMDVWFDSGTSWAGVLRERSSDSSALLYPADMYLEGSDQHRGWFQSSLLTAVATVGSSPYKTVLTHGFVLDEKGRKMSKSVGNVIDPAVIIEGGKNLKTHPPYGADTLRLWVAGVDYTSDVSIGSGIIKQVSDSYRKLRNTLRFLLGSVSDFDPAQHSVPYDRLPSVDKYMLGKLSEVFETIDSMYSSHQFFKATSLINHFAVHQLSNFYLDICKDRLYISLSNESRRRSCQTVLRMILEQFNTMIAPLIPHMAEDVYQNFPHADKSNTITSVFANGWIGEHKKFPIHEMEKWEFLSDLRGDVNHCIEQARKDKYIGASQECEVVLYVDHSLEKKKEIISSLASMTSTADAGVSCDVDDLKLIFLVSQVRVVSTSQDVLSCCPYVSDSTKTGLMVGVAKADGKKCNRCWYYSTTVLEDSETVREDSLDRRDLCSRCTKIVENTGA